MNKISVCLASYQGEPYIIEQLDSLRDQTRKIDEVIMYDDNSQDCTETIIRDYIHNNQLSWRFYKQEGNVGYIKNFASALHKCSGDIIFLCDQDDIWELHKVEKVMRLFDQHPEIGCINTSFTYMDAKNEEIQQANDACNYGMLWNAIPAHEFKEIALEEILFHNISMGCTMAFRSSLKDTYLQHSNFEAPHDWEINRIAALSHSLYFYQEKLIRYRIHEHNTVGNDNMNGRSNEKRIKNAHTMEVFSKSYERYLDCMDASQKQFCAEVDALCEKRYQLLQNHKKMNWLYLLCRLKSYHKMVSYKGMLADVMNK